MRHGCPLSPCGTLRVFALETPYRRTFCLTGAIGVGGTRHGGPENRYVIEKNEADASTTDTGLTTPERRVVANVSWRIIGRANMGNFFYRGDQGPIFLFPVLQFLPVPPIPLGRAGI